MKMLILAAIAVLIIASSFVGGWVVSHKSGTPKKEKTAAPEPKEAKKAGEPGKLEKSSKAMGDAPPQHEKSLDEQIADTDFSEGESRVRGRALLSQKIEGEGKTAQKKIDDEKDETEKKRQLDKSVQDWLKRTD